MITLCMDTSTKFLVLALIEEDRLIGKRCLSSWKRQSEMIFPQLTELLIRKIHKGNRSRICLSTTIMLLCF